VTIVLKLFKEFLSKKLGIDVSGFFKE